MKKNFFGELVIISAMLLLIACVPQRKYSELKNSKENSDQENVELQKKVDELNSNTKELSTSMETQKKQLGKLQEDTTMYGKEYRRIRSMYDKVNDLNNELLEKNEELLKMSNNKNKELLLELEKKKEALQIKEDSLYKLGKSIAEKQKALEKANMDLLERERKIKELDSLLMAQKSASELLKERLEKALFNFRNKGITVREENGKVYVSMEAQLLFASGKTEVNAEGKSAIIELARIIQTEKDLNIVVEGHTDTDKINSTSIPRDNWELSVLRATEVIKIITNNSSIDPTQLSAAGRGEFHPLDPENKNANRRIEIILEPNLKALYDIIE
ncbi:MAG: flagellar motor protein MotB [Bacteroidota bacterium]